MYKKVSVLQIRTNIIHLSRIEGFWKGFGKTFFLKKSYPEKLYLYPLDVVGEEKVPVS